MDEISDDPKKILGHIIKDVAPEVYHDALQPIARETGKALGTIGQVVNVLLDPFRGLIWGWDKIKCFIVFKTEEKLKDVPIEDIEAPDLTIAGPLIESLRFVGDERHETLRDMYASLLASAMDKTTMDKAHPSFVHIIGQLLPDEARILHFLSVNGPIPIIFPKMETCDCMIHEWFGYNVHKDLLDFLYCPDKIKYYIENLERLNLVKQDYGSTRGGLDELYQELISDFKAGLKPQREELKKLKIKYHVAPGILVTTEFGMNFLETCVFAHGEKQKGLWLKPRGADSITLITPNDLY